MHPASKMINELLWAPRTSVNHSFHCRNVMHFIQSNWKESFVSFRGAAEPRGSQPAQPERSLTHMLSNQLGLKKTGALWGFMGLKNVESHRSLKNLPGFSEQPSWMTVVVVVVGGISRRILARVFSIHSSKKWIFKWVVWIMTPPSAPEPFLLEKERLGLRAARLSDCSILPSCLTIIAMLPPRILASTVFLLLVHYTKKTRPCNKHPE